MAVELTTLTDGGQAPAEVAREVAAFVRGTRGSLDLALYDVRVESEVGRGSTFHVFLPRVAAELYRSARRLRVFTVRPASVDAARVVELVRLPGEAVAAQL